MLHAKLTHGSQSYEPIVGVLQVLNNINLFHTVTYKVLMEYIDSIYG